MASATPDHSFISSAGIVSASANVAPAQTSQMGFLISAAVKEVDVKEGDQVKAGQTLIVLHTPDLSLSVTAAKACNPLRTGQVDLLNYPYTKIFNKGHIQLCQGTSSNAGSKPRHNLSRRKPRQTSRKPRLTKAH
jgi:hypothetical protein